MYTPKAPGSTRVCDVHYSELKKRNKGIFDEKEPEEEEENKNKT